MAAWREEDHPRDERGRFVHKGGRATATQIKATLADIRAATDDALLDVFARVSGKDRLSAGDRRAITALDGELARRDAGGEREPTARERRVDQLIGGGASYEDAYAEVYGAGDQDDDADRRPGESREQVRRRQYAELVALQVLQAESATRGNLLNIRARSRGVDPVTLFSGPTARARKWASEELLTWWETHPRMTYAEFRAERIGDRAGAARARGRRRQDAKELAV